MPGSYASLKAVVVGGSAGSFPVVVQLLAGLTPAFPLPVVLSLHRLREKREGFVEALLPKAGLPVMEPDDKQPVRPGVAYLAPANYHLLVEPPDARAPLGRFGLSTMELVHYSRPSIDLTFFTAAEVWGRHLLGIMLSGANKDGGAGMGAVQRYGGRTWVQDVADATVPTMPEAALAHTTPDLVAPAATLATRLAALALPTAA